MEPVWTTIHVHVVKDMMELCAMILVRLLECVAVSMCILYIVMQECQEDFCLNGATCQIVAGEYLCICAEGYTGPDCGMYLMFDK